MKLAILLFSAAACALPVFAAPVTYEMTFTGGVFAGDPPRVGTFVITAVPEPTTQEILSVTALGILFWRASPATKVELSG